jgi:hypothetical protein
MQLMPALDILGDSMGTSYMARCDDCGTEFFVEEGGGFSFNLVRCDKCGMTKTIPLSRPDCRSTAALRSEPQEQDDKCDCGGRFGNNPPKCPNCGSMRYSDSGTWGTMNYD